MFDWMAWTWQTATVFVALFSAIALMAILEQIWPGGHERRGILGLTTTRGDRLFLTCLGGAWIMLAWLGFDGAAWWRESGLGAALGLADRPLLGGAGLIGLWCALVFWKV